MLAPLPVHQILLAIVNYGRSAKSFTAVVAALGDAKAAETVAGRVIELVEAGAVEIQQRNGRSVLVLTESGNRLLYESMDPACRRRNVA